MPRVVEEAGGELSAGYVFKVVRWCGATSGTAELGGRAVRWEVIPDGVMVEHPAVETGADPRRYLVPVETTVIASDGLRRWWSCLGCAARVDSLFLPPGADELRCRRCSRLTYRSQYEPGPVAARKQRPGLWSELTYRRWEYNPVTCRMVLVADRHTRRRL
jgi:hypothetical protein